MSDRKAREMQRKVARRLKRWEHASQISMAYSQQEQQEYIAPAWVREALR